MKKAGGDSVSAREQCGIEVGTILRGHADRIPALAWSAICRATRCANQNNRSKPLPDGKGYVGANVACPKCGKSRWMTRKDIMALPLVWIEREPYRPHPRHWQVLAELVGVLGSG
jgi:hypothetical protein